MANNYLEHLKGTGIKMNRAYLKKPRDPRVMSQSKNFGARCSSRRVVGRNSDVYLPDNASCQNTVFTQAKRLVSQLELTSIVSISDDFGRNIVSLFSGNGLSLLQINCSESHGKIDKTLLPHSITINPNDPYKIDEIEKRINNNHPTLIIVYNILEKISDPRYLLRALRRKLRYNISNKLIISSLVNTNVNINDKKITPYDPSYVRQWTPDELVYMLESSGFRVDNTFCVPQSGRANEQMSTIITEASCDDLYYSSFLKSVGYPEKSDHLVLTTEHSNALRTGGIGTYYQVAEELSRKPRIILYVGGHGLPSDWLAFIKGLGYLHYADLTGNSNNTLQEISVIDYTQILDAVMLLIFIYDNISIIEYQDYLGIGCHIAQAKKARMLPPNITVAAYAHGNHFYLDHASGDISKTRDLLVDIRERLSVELADITLFPSHFMQDLYVDSAGFELSDKLLQPYPFYIADNPEDDTIYREIDTLIFYGKQTQQKGYYDFCEALIHLFGNDNFCLNKNHVKYIYMLGCEEPDQRVAQFPNVTVVHGTYSRTDVTSLLASLAPTSLVILPYKGDNYPFSTFEVINSHSQILLYNAGGIPEQLPSNVHDYILCSPNYVALSEAILNCIRMPVIERVKLIKLARSGVAAMCEKNTDNYIAAIEKIKSRCRPSPKSNTINGNLSIIIPNFNGDKEYLIDALYGITNSTKQPQKIIFVDDHSDDEHFQLLSQLVLTLNGNTSIIRNSLNIGLSGSRDVGLREISTEYCCVHDNDNIIDNNFLHMACKILDENPDVVAVTAWLTMFNDGERWQELGHEKNNNNYHPTGQDIGLGLTQNCFGDALAVYRTAALNEVGGWDDSSKALWEDWQLFLKLTIAGKKIVTIPQAMLLYRVRPTSMARTYSNFNGWLRLSKTFDCVPRNQQFGIIRSANFKQCSSTDFELVNLRRELQSMKASRSWKITNPLRTLTKFLRDACYSFKLFSR
jgi:GT2 family glycosyltransferase